MKTNSTNEIRIKDMIKIIPKDKYYDKRVNNLINSIDKEVVMINNEIGAIAFINKIVFLKLVTWICNINHRRKGQASKALYNLKKRHRILFSKIQPNNNESYKFAMKNGFKELFKIPKFFGSYTGTLIFWRNKLRLVKKGED